MIDNTVAVEPAGSRRPSHRSADIPFTELGIAVRYEPQHTVVALTGELDVETAPILASRFAVLHENSRRRLVIDISALTFCDCSGLGALARANRRAVEMGGWVRLCGASQNVQKIIGIAGVSSVLRCYAGVAEALAGL